MASVSQTMQSRDVPTSKPTSTATCATLRNSVATPVESEIQTSSSYLLSDGSIMSREVDQWIQGWECGTAADSHAAAARKSRILSVQRSTLTSCYGLNPNGLYCALATVMPLLRANQRSLWYYTPSSIITTIDHVFIHLSQVCTRVRQQFQRLQTDRGMQEAFTTVLDVILVIYAIGFLFISMYESAIMA